MLNILNYKKLSIILVAALAISITVPSAAALSGTWTWSGFCGVMETDGKTTAGDFICHYDIADMSNKILQLKQEVPIVQNNVDILSNRTTVLENEVNVPNRATWIGVDCDSLHGNNIADCNDANVEYYTKTTGVFGVNMEFKSSDISGTEKVVGGVSSLTQQYYEDYFETIFPIEGTDMNTKSSNNQYFYDTGNWTLHQDAVVELFLRQNIGGSITDIPWCTLVEGQSISDCGNLVIDYAVYDITSPSHENYNLYYRIINVGTFPNGIVEINYHAFGLFHKVLEY